MSSLYAKGSSAVQIAEKIIAQIKNGEIRAGELLMPVRQLAKEIGVNPNTVASAYAKLRDAGWVATRGRAGTVVLEKPMVSVCSALYVPEGMHDLASGNIDAKLLPRLTLSMDELLPQQTGYDVAGDLSALRAVASEWIATQGVNTQTMAIFSGALDAIEKSLRCHLKPGDTVWVEDPCWPPLLTLLRHLRLKPLPLPIDEQGCRLPAENSERAGAVILTPRAQNPTGMTLSAARAQAWREFLAQHPACLPIVDDFWGPLSQQPLNLPFSGDNGVYVLSVSKFLGPDLRIAVCCGKPELLQAMRADQYIRERWVSHVLQQITANLWRQSVELLQRARQEYQQRRQVLAEKLFALAGIRLPMGEGLHIWLPIRSEAVASQIMAQRGWLVQSGEPFRLKSAPAIRISLANVTTEQLDALTLDISAAIAVHGQVN